MQNDFNNSENLKDYVDACDRAGIALWRYDAQSRKIMFSGRTCVARYFGSSEHEIFLNRNDFFEHSVFAEDRDELDRHFPNQNPFEGKFDFVFRLKRFGTDHCDSVELIGETVRKNDGEIFIGGVLRCGGDLFFGMLPERAPEKQRERHSSPKSEADARIKIMFDAMPLCCNLFDANFNALDCNLEAANLFDLGSREEYLEKFFELSPEFQPNGHSSRTLAEEYIREAFDTGRVTFEWMHQKLDGEPIQSEITLVRVRRDDHFIVVGYTRDLRELKKTQDERDCQRLLLWEILNSSPICFGIVADGELKLVAPFMTTFLGAKPNEMFSDLFVDRSLFGRLQTELEKNRIINWRPVAIQTKAGEIKEMLINLCFIDYYGENGIMVWMVDVTEKNRVEADLRLARDEAEASARAKSDFLANMSHEIRTPMNAILGMTHLALRTELTPKQKEYIESTEQSAKLLLRIINDILDFSKIEAGRMVMEYREFSLEAVIEDMESIVEESARKKGLHVYHEIADNVPDRLMGDSVRLSQVFVNLVNNAVKFTAEGFVRLHVDVQEQDELSVLLRFSVTDTGIGMTPIQMRSLFKPFSQADSSTTRKYGGTGLGLAISKSIVEMMKGEIHCESQPEQGTTFTFTVRFGLPLENDSLDDSMEIRTDALLLGDRSDSLAVIRHYLELLKCKIVGQCDSIERLETFLNSDEMKNVDFVVFDFEDLVGKGKAMLDILFEKKLNGMDSPPMLVFSEHSEIEPIMAERNFSHPYQVIGRPVVASELFNVLMLLTSRKKEELRESRKHQKPGDTASSESKFVIPEQIKGARILLAEDNRVNQMVATELLRMEGFQVDVAENGRQAIEMLHKNPYRLILMDIQMPEMDGLEAARTIRSDSRYQSLPILAMTAHAMSGDRELSLEAGMNDHITKPIDPTLLYNALAKWIK